MKFFRFGQKQKTYAIDEAASLIKQQLDETQSKNKSQMLFAAERLRSELRQLHHIIKEFAAAEVPETAKRSGNVKDRFCSVALRQLADMPQDPSALLEAAGSMLNTLGGLTQRQMMHINIFFREGFAPIARKMKEIERLMPEQSDSGHRRAFMLYQKLGSLEAKIRETGASISKLEEKRAGLSRHLDGEKNKAFQEPDDKKLKEARKALQEARQDIDSFLPVQKLLKKYIYATKIKDRLLEMYINSPSSAILLDGDLSIVEHVDAASKIFPKLNERKRDAIINGRRLLEEKRAVLEQAMKKENEEAAKYLEERERYSRLVTERQKKISSIENELREVSRRVEEITPERKELQDEVIKTRGEFCMIASKLVGAEVK